MASEIIKKINCGFCGSEADIRQSAKTRARLYILCPHCGQFWFNTLKGQAFLKSKLTQTPATPDPENSRQGAAVSESIEVLKVARDTPPPAPEKSAPEKSAPEKDSGIGGLEL